MANALSGFLPKFKGRRNICAGEDIEPKAFSMSHSFLSIDATIKEICNRQLYTKYLFYSNNLDVII